MVIVDVAYDCSQRWSAALWENAFMANRAVVQKWLPTATTNTASQDESVVGCFEGRKQSLEGETEV